VLRRISDRKIFKEGWKVLEVFGTIFVQEFFVFKNWVKNLKKYF
jgi:hypothetical protein